MRCYQMEGEHQQEDLLISAEAFADALPGLEGFCRHRRGVVVSS